MPGTAGTLVGIPVAWLFFRSGPAIYIFLTFALILAAIYVAEVYESFTNRHDRPEVVIDEIAGYVVTMALLPWNWKTALAGFVLFRIFDIIKPFPISLADKKVPGGFGVVLDDVMAGLASNVILQLLVTHTPWLGV